MEKREYSIKECPIIINKPLNCTYLGLKAHQLNMAANVRVPKLIEMRNRYRMLDADADDLVIAIVHTVYTTYGIDNEHYEFRSYHRCCTCPLNTRWIHFP